ncbi:MAG: CoA transferase [Lachnospiraceae bacterium]|nr:CoA transferase [Lachnospiraceae bacterium]
MEENQGILSGIKVLDFTIALAGAYTAWQLADLGAEVWKVERLGSGDQARYWDPCVEAFGGLSTLFVAYNKNKQSIEIDLRSDEGKEIIFRMAKEADIVLENFKSGSIDRLGIGYDTLKEINPKLVFLSLSGFGGTGPLMKYPCYDAIAEARSGLAACNGEPDGAPVKAGNANGDTLTGTYAFAAVMMALIDAEKTGQGCRIDIGMTDVAIQSCEELIMDAGRGKKTQMRFGNHDRFIAPYGIFTASDGWVAIIADTQARYQALCEALGVPSLATDSRFADNDARIAHRDALVQEIENVTKTMQRAEIEETLLKAGVPAAQVLPFIEAYTSDHANETHVTELVFQEHIGQMRFYTNPLRFNDKRCPIRAGAPLLGQHTRQVMKALRYSEAEIDRLYEAGVVASNMR